MSIHGIITGDLVGSRKVAPGIREKLFSDIDHFLQHLQGEWISSYETYRGDSLQCAAAKANLSLRVAVMIRAYLRSYIPAVEEMKLKEKDQGSKGYFSTEYDIRLGIGIGEADFIKETRI